MFFIVIIGYIFTAEKLFYTSISGIIFMAVMLFIFSYFLFGFSFLGFLFYSIFYHILPKNKKYDFIIIHGAGLINGKEVTPLLKGRIDTAIKAFKKSKNPDIKLIASGGKGNDEEISEAQAIANYIQTQNVPMDKVILEDKSTTTYENLLFSKEIGMSLIDKPRFLFVTNDYHVFRTSYYAKKLKMRGDGLGSKTAKYYIPSAFIREYIAIVVKIKWLFITPYIFILLLFTLSQF